MPAIRCPTCGNEFDPQTSKSLPFCSPRCRSIDLNRWLREEISMPYSELAEDQQKDDADRAED